ncbi:alpha/beta fold hydrolase [Spirosoma arboris]|nr:alpha/beta hydrolase [Spirosoma arboris]
MAQQLINGIHLYYEVHGTGEPLILISGLGGDHTFWQSSIPVLASHFQVIVYDTRGIGQTDAPEGVYSMALFADDLAGLMDALQLKKAYILGFSMGGAIAQAFTLAYPERVSKLILAATFAVMNSQARLFLDAVLAVYEQGATTRQMFDLILPWLFSARFLSNPENAAYLVYDEDDPYPQPLYAWRAQYLAQQHYSSLLFVHTIQVPTLVLAGEQDRLAHVDDAELLASTIQHAGLVIIPGSGHLINYEQPDLFHEHILDFISRSIKTGGQ